MNPTITSGTKNDDNDVIPSKKRGKKISADDYGLSRSQWIHLIDEYIFSEQDRIILKRRLLDSADFYDLTKEIPLSEERIKERFYAARNKLFKLIVNL